MNKHKCAAIGCAIQVGRSLLMCARHWAMVPFDLQQDVLVKWRAFNSAKELKAKLNASRQLRVAHEEAVKAVKSTEEDLATESTKIAMGVS